MKINNEFNLSGSEGSSNKAQNYFVIIHETANASATGRNEATYMKRNWSNAYTTDIIGDKGVDYRIGEWGYESWGALNANGYAPVQIELQHSLDKATFQENYKAYVELIRKACDTFGIPKTLDSSGKYTKGVKSHDWISKNWGGDHTDPYSYLAKMGISKAQLAKDIANGISSEGSEKPVAKPITHKKKARHNVRVYWFAAKNDAGLAKLKAYCKTNNMSNHEVKGKDGRIMLEIKYFQQWDSNKSKLTKFIEDSDWNYDVVLEK